MKKTKIQKIRFISLALLFCLMLFAACNDGNKAELVDGDGEADITTDGDTLADSDGDEDAIESDDDADIIENDLEAEAEDFEPFDTYTCLRDRTCEKVMVAAHRGDHSVHPPNTLAAIRGTAEIGARFVEMDIRHTADEKLVLMHDGTVDDTTDGTGSVDQMTFEEIRNLHRNGGDPDNPESWQVASFDEALSLCKELDIMIYLDSKSPRVDLMWDAIKNADAVESILWRDNASTLAQYVEEDPRLIVMSPVDNSIDLTNVLNVIPEAYIVEVSRTAPWPELNSEIREAGLHIQQDVMAAGDLRAMLGDYGGWKEFIGSGVMVLQTDMAHLLVPAVEQYNQTGVFPDTAPAK